MTKLFLRSLTHKMAPRRHMLILSAEDLVMEFSSLKTVGKQKGSEKNIIIIFFKSVGKQKSPEGKKEEENY